MQLNFSSPGRYDEKFKYGIFTIFCPLNPLSLSFFPSSAPPVLPPQRVSFCFPHLSSVLVSCPYLNAASCLFSGWCCRSGSSSAAGTAAQVALLLYGLLHRWLLHFVASDCRPADLKDRRQPYGCLRSLAARSAVTLSRFKV